MYILGINGSFQSYTVIFCIILHVCVCYWQYYITYCLIYIADFIKLKLIINLIILFVFYNQIILYNLYSKIFSFDYSKTARRMWKSFHIRIFCLVCTNRTTLGQVSGCLYFSLSAKTCVKFKDDLSAKSDVTEH